jgi:hypothetical protein
VVPGGARAADAVWAPAAGGRWGAVAPERGRAGGLDVEGERGSRSVRVGGEVCLDYTHGMITQ